MERDQGSGSPTEGLPRAFVPGNERERILAAVAEVVSVVGYRAMTLEEVGARVGLDPGRVQEEFDDEEAAFLAAYDAAVGRGSIGCWGQSGPLMGLPTGSGQRGERSSNSSCRSPRLRRCASSTCWLSGRPGSSAGT